VDDGIEIEDESLEALETLRGIGDDLAALQRMAKRLKTIRKALIRSVWDQNGLTLREAAQVFGVPKSTLQDWAHSGGWQGGRGR